MISAASASQVGRNGSPATRNSNATSAVPSSATSTPAPKNPTL